MGDWLRGYILGIVYGAGLGASIMAIVLSYYGCESLLHQ